MLTVAKLESEYANQAAVKRDLLKLDFSKCNESTNVGDYFSDEVTHDAIDVENAESIQERKNIHSIMISACLIFQRTNTT